jgi:hypothetical protein
MAVVSASAARSTLQGTFQFYMSNGTSDADTKIAAELTGAVVFRGEAGAGRARRLLDAGWNGRLWLDAARYDKDHSRAGDLVLWDEVPWLAHQRALGVMEVLSPGTYVPAGDHAAFRAAVAQEHTWLSDAGSGRLSLALEWSWLIRDQAWLFSELARLDVPHCVAFGHPNDPLAQRGAVAGLVALLDAVPDVMLVRSDIGALGALAHGPAAGAIGTGTSVRHVVPPGRAAGGARTGLPSVFVPALMDWKLPTVLARLPQQLVPRCASRVVTVSDSTDSAFPPMPMLLVCTT